MSGERNALQECSLGRISWRGWKETTMSDLGAPHDTPLLLCVEARTGRRRWYIGHYSPRGELHYDAEPWDGCEYDEEEDTWYAPPGWWVSSDCPCCDWTHSPPEGEVVGWHKLPPVRKGERRSTRIKPAPTTPRTHRAISVEALGVLASSTENFRFMLEDMGPGTVDAHDLSEVLATSGAALTEARSLLEEQDDE